MAAKNRRKALILKIFKKVMATLMALSIGVGTFALELDAQVINKPVQTEPILAEAAILMDVDTGTVLYEKNADEQLHPASITKIMTGLIACERGNMKDTVTFSRNAVAKNESTASSHIARDIGEKMTLEECMYGMMLASANECADAISEHIAGDLDSFVKLMNERAKQLGCTNTHFVCTNGLTDEAHFVSARDMAVIAAEAYKNPKLRKIMGTKKYTIPPTNIHNEPTYLRNQHDMVFPYRTSKYSYEYCTGGKTGYTEEAGNTLVTYAEKDGMRLVCVILKDTVSYAKYKDTITLFDYGFDNYQHYTGNNILDIKTDKNIKKLYKGVKLNELSLEGDFVTLPKGTDTSKVTVDIKKIKRKTGSDKVGKVTFKEGDEVLGTSSILNKAELKREKARILAEKKAAIERAHRNKIIMIAAIIVFIVIVIGITGFFIVQRRRYRDNWTRRNRY